MKSCEMLLSVTFMAVGVASPYYQLT